MGFFDPVKGFGVTFGTMFKKVTTEQYPFEPKRTAPRFHGRHQLNRHPDGLANSSGLVGKNMMFHPYGIITGFFDDPLPHTFQGALGNILMSQEFYETDRSRGFVRGYTYQMNRSTGPAKTAAGFLAAPIPWGQGHHEEFAVRFGKSSAFCVISERLGSTEASRSRS